MRRKMTSKHNSWGGPSGPPGFIPIVDSGDVWADESLHSVCAFRLTQDELPPVQEAMGHEPLGRYGNFSEGSDYFWAFPSTEAMDIAMDRGNAKLRELRPQAVVEVATEPPPSKKPSASDDVRPDYPYIESNEPLFALAEKRGVAPIEIIIDQLLLD